MRSGIATLADAATAELRERILSGELESGAPLRLEELARSLGTSISPVREAVRKLESLGLAVHVAHRGSRVKELDVGDLRDTYEARLALEPLAVAARVGADRAGGRRARAGGARELHAVPRARRPARRARRARRIPLHALQRLGLRLARAPDPPGLGQQRALPRALRAEHRHRARAPARARAHPRGLRRRRRRRRPARSSAAISRPRPTSWPPSSARRRSSRRQLPEHLRKICIGRVASGSPPLAVTSHVSCM